MLDLYDVDVYLFAAGELFEVLYVAEAYADPGPTLKRYQPVSKGRAHHILKRTSHITVILDTKLTSMMLTYIFLPPVSFSRFFLSSSTPTCYRSLPRTFSKIIRSASM